MNRYSFVKVDLDNVEQLRLIRNECRSFMTNNTDIISSNEQIEWFKKLNDDIKIFILNSNSDPIGYGLIRIVDNVSIISGGLKLSHRGLGIGKILFSHIIRECCTNLIRLEVLRTNERAIKTYFALGFKKTNETDRLMYMEYKL